MPNARNNSGADSISAQGPLSLAHFVYQYRCMYKRIAQWHGVDQSYVSRIARGERRHYAIEATLANEIVRLSRLGLALIARLPPGMQSRHLRDAIHANPAGGADSTPTQKQRSGETQRIK